MTRSSSTASNLAIVVSGDHDAAQLWICASDAALQFDAVHL
jgi:hypothetical protein